MLSARSHPPPAHRENLRRPCATPAIVLGHPIICISSPAGPETAAPPTIGLTAATGAAVRRKRLANSRHRQNRPDAGHGIARRKNNRLRLLDALDHARRRPRLLRAFEAHRLHLYLMPLAHEVFLKSQRTLRGIEHGRNAIVRHGQHPRANPELRRQHRRGLAQRLSRRSIACASDGSPDPDRPG